jgi:DNA-binding transcriptional regulator YiaG
MAKLTDCDPENNLELKRIRKELNLERRRIAEIARVSQSLVDSWLVKPESEYFRPMPGKSLRLLKLELGLDTPRFKHVRKAAEARAAEIRGV